MGVSAQAEALNTTIKANNPTIFHLLSAKGRAIFFPRAGILSQTAEARGSQINATIGVAIEADGTPMRLPSIEHKVLIDPENVFLYAPSFGKQELREAWKRELQKKNPSLNGTSSLPVVTNGITHGLNIVGYLFINPGDTVILPDKFWGNYRLIFENGFGGTLQTFNMFRNKRFDVESFRAKVSEGKGKTILLLNFPNNPTGYALTIDEARTIVAIIKEHAREGNQLCVICDDAYFGLFYETNVFQESLFALLADLDERVLAIKLDGATKEHYVWGLRVGFVTYAAKGISDPACRALEAKTAGVVRGSISNVSNLSQSLILAAIESTTFENETQAKYEILKSRYEQVQDVFKAKTRSGTSYPFSPLPYNSGYFMCIELHPPLDAEHVRQILLQKYHIGVIAINNLLRIAYSSVAKQDITQLFETINTACEEAAGKHIPS